MLRLQAAGSLCANVPIGSMMPALLTMLALKLTHLWPSLPLRIIRR
jgi:hypothetical protein